MNDDVLITAETKRLKEDELYHLRTSRRSEITEAIRKAREYGDLSENFEYQEARKQQSILNGKIAELEALLDRAKVVEEASSSDTVGIGKTVALFDEEEQELIEYSIVDATSADPAEGKISYSSPVGGALMGKRIGETVEVELPAGTVRYEVREIRPA